MRSSIKLKDYRKGQGRKIRKSTPKFSRSQLARIKRIARTEANKARAKSYIDYELGAYANDGSTYNTNGGWATMSENSDGTLLSVFAIPKADEDVTISTVSKRLSDFVWLREFDVGGIIRLQASTNDMCDFRVKVALFSFKRGVDPLTSTILTELPAPALYNDLNGSPMDESQVEDYSKVEVLASKVITCRPTRAVELFKPFRLRYKFKKPQMEQWDPNDSDGENPQLRTYFFAAWQDRILPPDAGGTAVQQGQICCNVRLHYFQE